MYSYLTLRCVAATALVAMTVAQADRKCLDCICKVESDCKPLDCKPDAGSLSCGYYQIKKPYYIDCGEPGKRPGESTEDALTRCGKDKECSEKCVQAYLDKYAKKCNDNVNCEVYARVHNGGPQGCKNDNTQGYWKKVKKCLDG